MIIIIIIKQSHLHCYIWTCWVILWVRSTLAKSKGLDQKMRM